MLASPRLREMRDWMAEASTSRSSVRARISVLDTGTSTPSRCMTLRFPGSEDDAKEEKKGKLPWPSKGKW